jgi:phage terminase Nu1 subunit (DNA packaging protein)
MRSNRNQIADVLGVNKVTIDTYVRDGMPAVERADRSRGIAWVFDTADCIKWLVDRAGARVTRSNDAGPESFYAAKSRDKSAVAGLRELQLAERRRELVAIDDVAVRVEEQYAIVKSGLRAIPGRVSQVLAVEADPARVEAVLKTEINVVLSALSAEEAAHGDE